MKKIIYPAIFKKEEVGYSVSFPDLVGCNTEGDSIEEAYEMAFDALGLYLETIGEQPVPTEVADIKIAKNEILAFIEFDSLKYAAKHSKKSIKKTLSIPEWLNIAAEKKHINFSKTLQTALKKELGVL